MSRQRGRKINLEKAIEIKKIFYNGGEVPNWEDYRQADNLSIEALGECKRARAGDPALDGELLPGETEE